MRVHALQVTEVKKYFPHMMEGHASDNTAHNAAPVQWLPSHTDQTEILTSVYKQIGGERGGWSLDQFLKLHKNKMIMWEKHRIVA